MKVVGFEIYEDKNYSLKKGMGRRVFLNNIDWENVEL